MGGYCHQHTLPGVLRGTHVLNTRLPKCRCSTVLGSFRVHWSLDHLGPCSMSGSAKCTHIGSSNECPIDYPTLLTGLHWTPLESAIGSSKSRGQAGSHPPTAAQFVTRADEPKDANMLFAGSESQMSGARTFLPMGVWQWFCAQVVQGCTV